MKHFTIRELSRSTAATERGILNEPPPEVEARLIALVDAVLDPLREALSCPVRVTSGYRSPAVNAAIGGSATSQHVQGEAADIRVRGVASEELARLVVALALPFDQLIWYDPERGGHLHVSHTARRANRGQTLHAPAGGGYVRWTP